MKLQLIRINYCYDGEITFNVCFVKLVNRSNVSFIASILAWVVRSDIVNAIFASSNTKVIDPSFSNNLLISDPRCSGSFFATMPFTAVLKPSSAALSKSNTSLNIVNASANNDSFFSFLSNSSRTRRANNRAARISE